MNQTERGGRPAAYGEVVADLDAGYASTRAAVAIFISPCNAVKMTENVSLRGTARV